MPTKTTKTKSNNVTKTKKKTAIPQKKVVIIKKADGTIVKKIIENNTKPRKIVRSFIDPTISNKPVNETPKEIKPINPEPIKVVTISKEQILPETTNKQEELKPIEKEDKDNTQENINKVENNNTNIVNESPKPINKKKKHKGLKALVAFLLFGGVAGGVAYPVYKLITQKQEEYKRDVSSTSEDVSLSGKQVDNNYVISASTSSSKEITKLTSVKIGDEIIDPSNYIYDSNKNTITFTIEYLKTKEGKITVEFVVINRPSISIDKKEFELEVNQTGTIKATVKNPKEGLNITWTVDKKEVVELESENNDVESTCNFKVIGVGTATITAKYDKYTATSKIVATPTRIEALLSYKPYNIDDEELTSEVEEKDVDHYKVYWDSTQIIGDDKLLKAIIPATYKNKNVTGFAFDETKGQYGTGAFESCTKLEKVYFEKPENITKIDKSTFNNCIALNYIDFMPNLKIIYENAFVDTPIKSFKIPSSLTRIEVGGFSKTEESTTYIKSLEFENKKDSLFYIDYPRYKESVDQIDFKDKSAEDSAISLYEKNKYHILSKKTTEDIKFGYVGYDENDHKTYEPTKIDHYRIYCNNLDLRSPKGEITIPSKYNNKDVIGFADYRRYEIQYNGFERCENITGFKFEDPTLITSIEYNSFNGCKSLEKVDLSSCINLKTISAEAFENCTNLSSVKLPDTLESILFNAFYSCPNLKSFNSDIEGVCNLPASITYIGTLAFALGNAQSSYTTNFNKVIFNGKTDNICVNSKAFGEYSEDKKDLFKLDTTNDGDSFYYIINSNENSKNDYYIFAGPTEIIREKEYELIIKDGCKTISENCLNSSTIITVNIPKSIDFIPFMAFQWCTIKDYKFNHPAGTTWTIYNQSASEPISEENFNPNDGQEKTKERTIGYLQTTNTAGMTFTYQWVKNNSEL